MSSTTIDWKVVNQHLKCPECGEKATIDPGTDGFEASHEHRFRVSREHAMTLTRLYGKPTYEELEAEVKRLKEERARYNNEQG